MAAMPMPPNFDPNALAPGADPSNPGRGPAIIGTLWALTITATIIVVARLYVRNKITALGWDDWLMLVALIFQLVDIGFITKAYSYGLGMHDRDMTFNQVTNALKWGWLWMIPGTFVAVLARVSGAIFLNRLFGVRRWFRWFLYIFTTLQVLCGTAVLLVTFAGTTPVQALWNPFIPATRVSPHAAISTAYFAQAVFTFADLTYVMLPVSIIWKLNMSIAKRLVLIGLMATSLITMIASILKILTLQTTAGELTEPQYASSFAALWSGVEQTLVIAMASIPALSAVTQMKFPFFSRLGSSLASRFGIGTKKSLSAGSDEYSDTHNVKVTYETKITEQNVN